MKRLITFVLLFLFLLGGMGYLYYQNWANDRERSAIQDFIPANTALVYKTENLHAQWKAFQTKAFAKGLTQLPFFTTITEHLALLNSLTHQEALDNLPLEISIHPLGQKNIGYVFYLNTHHGPTQKFIQQLLKSIGQEPSYNTAQRDYAGHTITEITKNGQKSSFSYLTHHQHLIGSFSPILIEDIIRNISQKTATPSFEYKRINHGKETLFINYHQLPQLVRIFFKDDQDALFMPLIKAAQAAQLDLHITDHHLFLHGFTTSKDSTECLTAFAQQKPQPFQLSSYIPNSTAMLQQFSVSNIAQWLAAHQQHNPSKKDNALGTHKGLEPKIASLYSALYTLMKGTMGHCILQEQAPTTQLLFIEVHNTSKFLGLLEKHQLINLVSPSQPHQLTDTYSLYALQHNHFVETLLPDIFPSFSARYLTYLDDYIVLANTRQAYAIWVEQYQQGQTWANALEETVFLENTLDNANFSLFINIKKAWPYIMHLLKPVYKQIAQAYPDALQTFEHLALQWTHEKNNDGYTSILLRHTPHTHAVAPAPEKKFIGQTFQADASIITKPFVVKSHIDHSLQVLFQDDLHQLYLLDKTGTLIWKKPLESPITTNIFQVDFYKNHKLQYLFATQEYLYLIDRNGDQVAKYPHPLPCPGSLAYLNVIDYDGNKDYRFLIADQAGNIYLYNQYFKPLEGWSPKRLGAPFVQAPSHIRVQQRDCFIALQCNGQLSLFNRRGKLYKGFPINLNTNINTPLHIKKGNTFANTTLTMLSTKGERIVYSLQGVLQRKIQLYTAANNTHFSLCPNQAPGNAYIMMRQGDDKVTLLDEGGNIIFEKPYVTTQPLLLQYYAFDSHQQVYAITDSAQHATYLYDATGALLYDQPLENDHKLGLLFLKAHPQLILYRTAGAEYAKYRLPIPPKR